MKKSAPVYLLQATMDIFLLHQYFMHRIYRFVRHIRIGTLPFQEFFESLNVHYSDVESHLLLDQTLKLQASQIFLASFFAVTYAKLVFNHK